jgi:hypothetical protein
VTGARSGSSAWSGFEKVVEIRMVRSQQFFIRSKSGGERRGKGERNWREGVAVSDKGSAV